MFDALTDKGFDLAISNHAGAILSEGRSVAEMGEDIYRMILRVASGEMSKSEAQGLGDYEFVPWQIGAVM